MTHGIISTWHIADNSEEKTRLQKQFLLRQCFNPTRFLPRRMEDTDSIYCILRRTRRSGVKDVFSPHSDWLNFVKKKDTVSRDLTCRVLFLLTESQPCCLQVDVSVARTTY